MPILVEKLSYSYMQGASQAAPALHNIDLQINEGEFLGLIGHTGSGKSTFVQHLNGLLVAQSGSIHVDGYDMSDKKQRLEGRKLVGLVFQYPEYQLFEESVFADVAYGPKNMGLTESEIRERVNEALFRVGLMPELFAAKSPFELSGGEKRRAAIAGILAMRPRYLVLDEPMAGLDPSGRQSILDMLDAMREETGCAIIMVSHSMDDMARKAERIVVVQNGSIVRSGTPGDIFGEAEFLSAAGLDIPQISALAAKLRSRGLNIPHDIYDIDGMLDYLKTRRGEHV